MSTFITYQFTNSEKRQGGKQDECKPPPGFYSRTFKNTRYVQVDVVAFLIVKSFTFFFF